MRSLQALVVVAASLAMVKSLDYHALNQFRDMIVCVNPTSWPILDYADYGCYCGLGGTGEAVDELDKCCQVHDQCYTDAMQHDECWPFFDNPYTEYYAFQCDEENNKVTCDRANNKNCEHIICECDRKAAECFGRATWNPEHEHLPSDQCE